MTEQVRFRVLGPLRAFRGELEVPLGAAKQRAVLAVLLMRAGRCAGRDEIVAAVWGAQAPDSATSLVATYVAGLRRALEPSQLITSAPGGYLLRAEPDQLDLTLFDADVAAGQQARERDDLQGCSDALATALSRWRGLALEGVPGPHADQVRIHLAERRLAVVEQRIEAELACGRHADWVAELFRLAGDHPLREPLHGLLMQALLRSGRRAEAMTVFQQMRHALVEELGVEPSAPLRDTYQRTLADEVPALGRGDQVPRQLPAAPPDLVGRDEEVARLTARLTPACVVTGAAGVGKTALVVRVAHTVAQRFPDGQLFVDLRGSQARPLTSAEVLARLLTDLGVPFGRLPHDIDQRAALLRTTLSGRRVLLVLDDARDGAQVRSALPGGAHCAVLVTSRARVIDLPVGHLVHLDPLDDEAARSLLASVAGVERTAAEPEHAERIVALCGGLPRALRTVGVRLAGRPLWTLETYTNRAVLEDVGEQTGFRVEYEALTASAADAARVFRLLGSLPGADIGPHTAAAVLEVTTRQAERTLEFLADAHLVEPTAAGGYRFQRLLQLFAREQAERRERPSVLDALSERALDFYRVAAYEADRLLRPGRRVRPPEPASAVSPPTLRGAADAVTWWEAERANLVGVALAATRKTDAKPHVLAALLSDLRGFLHRRGYWDDWENLAEAIVRAALRQSDPGAQAVASLELGTLASVRTRSESAIDHLRRSIVLFRQVGDELGEGRALNNVAVVQTNRGAYAEAAASLRHCLDLQRASEDRNGECITLDNLATLHVRRKNYAAAKASCERSIHLHDENGTTSLSSVALTVLGLVHSRTGRHQDAVRTVNSGLELARADGNRYREAYALADLGAALHAAQRSNRAVEPLESALALQRELRDEFGLAGTLRSLGSVLGALGDEGAARRHATEARELLARLNLPQ